MATTFEYAQLSNRVYAGADIAFGNAGVDALNGGAGNDRLIGHDDASRLPGAAQGADYLDGRAGVDLVCISRRRRNAIGLKISSGSCGNSCPHHERSLSRAPKTRGCGVQRTMAVSGVAAGILAGAR